MDEKRSEFLTTMIGILERLQQTCGNKGELLLADMLAIARTEAVDALRHCGELDRLTAKRKKGSSARSWRACDQLPEFERSAAATEADSAQPPVAETTESTKIAA